MSDYYVSLLESNAKRLTKPKLAEYAASLLTEGQRDIESARKYASKLEAERDATKREASALKAVRDLLAVVLRRRTKVTDAQLALILGQERDDLSDEGPEAILGKLLDNADAFLEAYGTVGVSYDDLLNTVYALRDDREALLKRLGLTDRQWSMLPEGVSFADLKL